MSVIETYLEENAKFEADKAALAAVSMTLLEVGRQLASAPEGTCFSNTNVGLPADIVMSQRTKTYDARSWPSPEKIQQLIHGRFEARRKGSKCVECDSSGHASIASPT